MPEHRHPASRRAPCHRHARSAGRTALSAFKSLRLRAKKEGTLHHIMVHARAAVDLRDEHMSYAYKLNEDVRHQPQGPQGRTAAEPPMMYTIVQLMPIEADGRLRYRIKSKSENIERVVTEDQLSYCQVI